MTRRLLVSVFDDDHDLLHAAAAARKEGLEIVDVLAPHAVHGVDRVLGLRPTRLPWVCFLLGLAGAAGILLFQYWATITSWPINVGGKPWNSLAAFVPATFEVMVLCAGVGTFLAFIWRTGLRPGGRSAFSDLRVTDDRFALVLLASGSSFDLGRAERLLAPFHPVTVEERFE